MAEDGCTFIGFDELKRDVQTFPARVSASLRGVAFSTAARVMANARANLAARTHGTGATAAAIHIIEDEENRQFIVESPGVAHPLFSSHTMTRSGRSHTQRVTQNNLPIWLEYGWTMRNGQPHRGYYYMHDAATAENARYAKDMEAVALAEARNTLER